jgi:hypothetical protein
MNIRGDTIPRPIQVSIQPTQFIVVPRCKVAGDKYLYSAPFSASPRHIAPSVQQNIIDKTAAIRIPAIIGPLIINPEPRELYAYEDTS